jgi:hypothetical protein
MVANLLGRLNLRESLEANPNEGVSSVEYAGKPSMSSESFRGSGEVERAIFSSKFGWI